MFVPLKPQGEIYFKRAYIVQRLRLVNIQTNTIKSSCQDDDYLRDITFPDFDSNQVSIFLGIDFLDLFTTTGTTPRAMATALRQTRGYPTADMLDRLVFSISSTREAEPPDDGDRSNLLVSTRRKEL